MRMIYQTTTDSSLLPNHIQHYKKNLIAVVTDSNIEEQIIDELHDEFRVFQEENPELYFIEKEVIVKTIEPNIRIKF